MRCYCFDFRFLKSLLRFDGVGEYSIRLGVGVSFDQASDGLAKKLQVIKRVVSLDLLVKVGVESNLLDVLGVAKFDEGLSGSVVRVEDLLQDVQNSVGRSVKAVVFLKVGLLDFFLGRKSLSTIHELDNFFGCHAARLGGKVDTFSGALGNVSGGVTDKCHTSLDTTRTVVLRDGVGFDLDDLSSCDLVSGTVADGLLVLLDGRSVDDGTGSDSNVVVLGEDPTVEIRGDIVTDVHLSHFFVEGHLVFRDLNSLLESDGEVVFTGIHGLGDTRVGTIGSDDHIDLHLIRGSGALALLEFLVVKSVLGFGSLVVGRDINSGDKTVDRFGSVFNGAVSEVLVHDFTTAHTNVLIGLESISNGNLGSGRGDKIHSSDLTVDNGLRNVEFSNHAKRNGSSTWLGIVHLTLEHDGINSLLLGEDLGSASSRRSSSDDGNLVSHVHVGSIRCDGIGGNRGLSEERRVRGECTGGSGEGCEGDNRKLHFRCFVVIKFAERIDYVDDGKKRYRRAYEL